MTPEEIKEFETKVVALDNNLSRQSLQPVRSGDPSIPSVTATTKELLASPGFPEPGSGIAGIDDVEAFFNMRAWLEKACTAAGARRTGGGIGLGQADIDIELEGYHYNISIRPRRR